MLDRFFLGADPRHVRPFHITSPSHLTLAAASIALAVFVSVRPASAQEAPDAELPAATENLPTVTIETTVESAKPENEGEAPAKPVVKVESDDDAPPKRAKKTVKAAKPKKPVQSAPLPEDYEPAVDPVDTVSSSALAGASPSPRGGPSQIDGYIAKQTTTATKTDTPLIDVPQSVSITTVEQASDQGSKSLAQALTYVPGVNVAQGEGQRDQITIRGQSTTADFYVDGVRDDVEYYRDLYNVEAIEVVKGPNAMIFGRGGSGGVVNRSTKQADGQTIREGTITYGMFDTKRATMDVGEAISSSAAFRLNAMYENSENYRDHFDLERFGINPTLGFKLSDETKLLLSYEFYKDDRTVDRGVPGVASTGRPLEGFRDTFFGNPDVSRSNYEGHRLSISLAKTSRFAAHRCSPMAIRFTRTSMRAARLMLPTTSGLAGIATRWIARRSSIRPIGRIVMKSVRACAIRSSLEPSCRTRITRTPGTIRQMVY